MSSIRVLNSLKLFVLSIATLTSLSQVYGDLSLVAGRGFYQHEKPTTSCGIHLDADVSRMKLYMTYIPPFGTEDNGCRRATDGITLSCSSSGGGNVCKSEVVEIYNAGEYRKAYYTVVVFSDGSISSELQDTRSEAFSGKDFYLPASQIKIPVKSKLEMFTRMRDYYKADNFWACVLNLRADPKQDILYASFVRNGGNPNRNEEKNCERYGTFSLRCNPEGIECKSDVIPFLVGDPTAGFFTLSIPSDNDVYLTWTHLSGPTLPTVRYFHRFR